MRTLALTETSGTLTSSAIPLSRVHDAKPDAALEGILVFCGISFTLGALAVVFHALSLPPALLF